MSIDQSCQTRNPTVDKWLPSRRWRTAAISMSGASVIAIPVVLPLITGEKEDFEQYRTAVTPPDYAFAIWAPIFAGIATNVAHGWRSDDDDHRVSDVALTCAYGLNAMWSIAAQTRRFTLTPILLPAATASAAYAYRALQRNETPNDTVTTVSTGLLLGWTALASTINASVGSQLAGANPTSRVSVTLTTGAAMSVAAGIAVAISKSTRGYAALAAAATWGLATAAFDTTNKPLVRAGLGASAAGVAASAVVRWRSMRSAALVSAPTADIPTDG